MPALTVFNRRWLVAGDDLPGPAIFLATFHLIWVALLSTWLREINGPDDCQDVGPYYVAVGGLLASFALSFLLEVAIALVGFRGSLFETEKRASLPPLIYATAACLISQIGFNIYASYLITQQPPVCTGQGGKPFNPVEVMHGAVWSTWAIIFGTIVFIISAYNMFPDYKNPEEWEKQCECLALTCWCCPGTVAPTSMASPLTFRHKKTASGETSGGTHAAVPRRLGAIFALMFSHIDFTPTDCLVAFSLAMKRQEIRRNALFAAMSRRRDENDERHGGVKGGEGIPGKNERIRPGNKTMGGIRRAASAVRGFRSNTITSLIPTTAGTSTTVGDGSSSYASGDGLLSELELMEAGRATSSNSGTCKFKTGDYMGGGGGGGGVTPLDEEIEFHPQFSHSFSNTSEIDDEFGRSRSRAGVAALRRKRSVEPITQADVPSPASPAVGSVIPITQEDQLELEEELEGGGEEAAYGLPRPLNTTPTEPEILQEAAYYMKYAFAAYGWMLFVYSKKTTGLFKLCCGRGFGLISSIVSRKHGVIPFANPLQAPYFNNEAILQATEIVHEGDLVDVRLEAEVQNVLPYYIAIDRVKKVVVLAIRGSLSMEDVIRDLLFEPADLDLWVEEKRVSGWDAPLPDLRPATESTRYAAHSGIFEAARATMADIQSTGVLASLLLGPGKQLPDYNLVVCGHSLGAGVAFLLSLRIRQFIPGLKCWSFSPPGGLATAELSAGAVDWCTSVICGKEIIPRLTLATFERARDEMVYCAARCRLNKWSVFLSWISGRVYKENEMFYSAEDLPKEPQNWLEGYRESLGSTSAKREYVELATKFGPPGKCLYLKPSGKKAEGKRTYRGGIFNLFNFRRPVVRDYQGVWVDGEALVEQGIVISGRMMLDHFPDYALAVLRRLASAGGHGAAAHVSDAAGESEVKNRLHTPPSPRTAAGFEVE